MSRISQIWKMVYHSKPIYQSVILCLLKQRHFRLRQLHIKLERPLSPNLNRDQFLFQRERYTILETNEDISFYLANCISNSIVQSQLTNSTTNKTLCQKFLFLVSIYSAFISRHLFQLLQCLCQLHIASTDFE